MIALVNHRGQAAELLLMEANDMVQVLTNDDNEDQHRKLGEYYDPEDPYWIEEELSKAASNIEVVDQSGRDSYWDLDWDSFRQKTRIWSGPDGDRTMANFHYLVLPMWYNDESPQEAYDQSILQEVLNMTTQYYTDMSWGQHALSFELLEQVELNLSMAEPLLGDAKTLAKAHVASLNITIDVDYDGIILIYKQALAGNMANGGGYGEVNGVFTWMTLPGGFAVTRHEVCDSCVCSSLVE